MMALEAPPSREETRRLLASTFPQFLAAFLATLSALAAGAAIAWSSPVLPLLQAAHVLTEDQVALAGALTTLGAFLGALPAGAIASVVGRKGLLELSTVPMLVSCGMVSFTVSPWGLYASRLLAGLGVGAVTVAAPLYISEISEDTIRGTLGTFFQLQISIGILFAYIIGLLKDTLYISLICSSLPLLFICTFIWMPETPRYLLTNGRHMAAEEALQWLRGSHYNIQPELSVLEESVRQSKATSGAFIDIIDIVTFPPLLVSLGLMAFQQLSAVNAIIVYSQPIFEAAGNAVDPKVSSIVIGFVQVLATYSSTVLIERAGRRRLLLVSSSIMSLCLALVGLCFLLQGLDLRVPTGLILLFLAVFIFAFSLGFGPVPWVVTGELFPSSLKGVASSLAASVSWLLAFIVTYLFSVLKMFTGYSCTFCVFSGFSLLGTIFVAYVLPETKGKDFETIREELRKPKIFKQEKRRSTDTISPLL